MKIQRTEAAFLEEQIYLRILAEAASERLLRQYIKESFGQADGLMSEWDVA